MMHTLPGIAWRGSTIPLMVLGTAQLGMPYGIANRQGLPSPAQAREIINAAWDSGVRFFDTAQAYGQSESVLGEAFKALDIAQEARVISKLSPEVDPANEDLLLQSIEKSCTVLGVERLWGMMLHRADWLSAWDTGPGPALRAAKHQSILVHIGVSAYTTTQARAALEQPEVDIIQVPVNAWDHRMLAEGIISLADKKRVCCFTRSVFLQGLLTMSPAAVRDRLPEAYEAALHWHRFAQQYNMTPQQAAVAFARSLGTPLVIGAETVQQVLDNAALLQQAPLDRMLAEELNRTMAPLVTERITDPSLWQLQTQE